MKEQGLLITAILSFLGGVLIGIVLTGLSLSNDYHKGVIEGRNEILTQIVKERGLLNIEEIEK